MKTKWIILSLVFGLLFFGLGCMADSVAIEGIGAVAFFPWAYRPAGEDLAGGVVIGINTLEQARERREWR